jgi:hypothetical protein
MKVSWLTRKMLLNAGYVERSHPKAIVKNWIRSGINPFPRFHVVKDIKYDIHLDKQEEHGKSFGFKGIETKGNMIDWELKRIKYLHHKAEFEKIEHKGFTGNEKKKKLLSNSTNFYQLILK